MQLNSTKQSTLQTNNLEELFSLKNSDTKVINTESALHTQVT